MKNLDQEFMVNRYIGTVTKDKKIIEAFAKVPRFLFIPEEHRMHVCHDHSLPIGYGQTISQPSLVAEMIEKLSLKGKEKVLEIGTGSGYQSALLSYLADKVYSIEFIPELAKRAKKTLAKLKIKNVYISVSDGTMGLGDQSPFDAIIVAATGNEIPLPLIEQLKDGGRIVIPLVTEDREAVKLGTKRKKKLIIEDVTQVRFVPLMGKYGLRLGSVTRTRT